MQREKFGGIAFSRMVGWLQLQLNNQSSEHAENFYFILSGLLFSSLRFAWPLRGAIWQCKGALILLVTDVSGEVNSTDALPICSCKNGTNERFWQIINIKVTPKCGEDNRHLYVQVFVTNFF